MTTVETIAKQSYEAFANSDRAASEALLAEDFRFTSPLDNAIDRATFYKRCWPNSAHISAFKFIHVIGQGDKVFVTYEGKGANGKVFRNTELVTIRDGKIGSIEVYFGWNVPHDAPENSFLDDPVTGTGDEIGTIFGQVSCSDFEESVAWFSKLFHRSPTAEPMEGLAEWRYGKGGMQLHKNTGAAGKTSLTLIVQDIASFRLRLMEEGLAPGEIEKANYVSLARLRDPDKNLIVIAEYYDRANAPVRGVT